MATSLATLETNLGYHLGSAPSATSRWTTTVVDVYLNSALKKVVDELYQARCWKLLRELQKDASYTLTADTTQYSVYTIIGSSTDYYGFVNARLNTYKCREVTIEDEDRIQSNGEFYPTSADPWICFYGYDSTSNHGNLPYVKIRPQASAGTLQFRYLITPPTMATTPTAVASCLPSQCDNAIIFLAASWCWSGDRNATEHARFYQLYKAEMADLIAQYSENVFYDIDYRPVI